MNSLEFLNFNQFSLDRKTKKKLFIERLNYLHEHHNLNCDIYRKTTNKIFNLSGKIKEVEEFPFIPVSIFKNFDVKSITEKEQFKILTSSGTTGQIPSRIFLDKDSAKLQQVALSKIFTHVLGNERLPMMIIDSKSVLKNRDSFSARGAGILGISIFGKKHKYILDDNFNFDEKTTIDFINENNGKKILIFGFTFMVWQHLTQLTKKIDLSNAILIHSGGWKKLKSIAVDNSTFKEKLNKKFGIKKSNIINFYGMIEQIGSVFLENKLGFLHCPNFADIIIRNPKDFSVQPHGEEGLVQVVSLLPTSYPGHSLLTEDIGVVLGEDSENNWKGKYFKILGRSKKAELRGCSDTSNN